MPTTKNTVTAYVADDIKNCLSDYANEKGISQSKALEEILTIFFKGDLPDTIPSESLEEMVQKEVQAQLKKINPLSEDEIEGIVEARLGNYHQQLDHALEKLWEKVADIEDATENTSSTGYPDSTVGENIKQLFEKLADIENSLEQFENLSTKNTPHLTHFKDAREAQKTYIVEFPANLEQIEQTTSTSPDAVPPTPQPDTNEPTPPQPTPPIVPRKTRFDGVEGSEDNETTPDVYTYEQLENLFPLKRSTLESAKSRAKARAKEKGRDWNGIIDSKGYTLQFVSEGNEGVRIRVLDVPQIAE